MHFARTVWRFFLPLLAISILLFIIGWWTAGAVFIFGAFFILFFFRDPERIPPSEKGALVSPADGRVDVVEEVEHSPFPGGRAVKVGIFLSIFDVHINRAPADGRVMETSHRSGSFMSAMRKKSSETNESNLIVFETPQGAICVRQIAGLIARRIICNLKKGDHVQRGDRIGLICFGSRTEAFLPSNALIKVKPGMRVKGGSSIIAFLPNTDSDGASLSHEE
ncbi:MAG: phosphatidylserine decarboxylase family protein [Candidatus Sumerlaeota bacterium]|nr:phosphatidylserine decarboxylase family protein [Candidatus Sumerlaeota bacterium]